MGFSSRSRSWAASLRESYGSDPSRADFCTRNKSRPAKSRSLQVEPSSGAISRPGARVEERRYHHKGCLENPSTMLRSDEVRGPTHVHLDPHTRTRTPKPAHPNPQTQTRTPELRHISYATCLIGACRYLCTRHSFLESASIARSSMWRIFVVGRHRSTPSPCFCAIRDGRLLLENSSQVLSAG
jgi:hypothetical protein